MKKLLISFILLVLLINSCFAIDVSARSAILYEPETKTVLFEKNANDIRPIASTTKIMTAVVVLENSELSDVVTVPESCTGIEGTSMYLKQGEKLTVEELLYGMLLLSGNDAAETLAYYTGDGNRAHFIEMMNETAKRIGMNNSSFKNPSGLPDDEHYSTACDMALLASYALGVDGFSEIVSTYDKNISGRYLKNHNKLLKIYEGANGFKTGFTKSAGRCLVSGAKREDMQLVAVTLSAPDDWNDHKKLLDFGFENFLLLSERAETFEIPIVGAAKKAVNVTAAAEISLLTKKGETIGKIIYAPRFLYAPISKGDIVGKIEYLINGELKETVSVVSSESIEATEKVTFWSKLFDFFNIN